MATDEQLRHEAHAVANAEALKRRIALKVEREKWREARAVYEQTLKLVEAIWGDRLDAAQTEQQKLAEGMRDRTVSFGENSRDVTVPGGVQTYLCERCGVTSQFFPHHTCNARGGEANEIPVPLFTPRDRLQFLKEATTAFLIFGEKRNLRGVSEAEPEAKPAAPEPAPPLAETPA